MLAAAATLGVSLLFCDDQCVSDANGTNAPSCAQQYQTEYDNMVNQVNGENLDCPGQKFVPLQQSVTATQWAQCNGGKHYK